MGQPAYQLFKTNSRARSEIVILDSFQAIELDALHIILETPQYLSQNNICIIEFRAHDGEKKALTAEVISVALSKVINETTNPLPVYKVFLKFIDLDEDEKRFLDKIINRFTH